MIALKPIKVLLLILLILPFKNFASDGSEDKEFNATKMIMHHIQDAHEWHFWGEGENAVTLPLPIILKTDNGIVSFMSSEFHHDDSGKTVVEKNGMKFVKYHEKIYQLNNGENAIVVDEASHSVTNAVKPLDFSITKNVAMLFMVATIMLLLFLPYGKSYKKNRKAPKGINNVLETLVLFVRDEVAMPNIGAKKYMKYMPFLLTVFFLIWIGNLLGLLPGAGNLTGNIAVTMTLASFTLLIILFTANKDYWKHIFWMPGVPVLMKLFLMPIELIGVFTKPFALMIRLFANITAGHIVILSLLSFIFTFKNVAMAGFSIPFSLFISVIELLVAFIQAFIFTMLSALFIGMAVQEHDHH